MRKQGWSVHQCWVTPTTFSILHEVGVRIADVSKAIGKISCIWRAAYNTLIMPPQMQEAPYADKGLVSVGLGDLLYSQGVFLLILRIHCLALYIMQNGQAPAYYVG